MLLNTYSLHCDPAGGVVSSLWTTGSCCFQLVKMENYFTVLHDDLLYLTKKLSKTNFPKNLLGMWGITCFFCTNSHCPFVDNFSPVFCKETIETSKKRASFTVRVISMGSSRKRYHGGEKFFIFIFLPGKDYFPQCTLLMTPARAVCYVITLPETNEC